jgi:hypothetical protein
MSTVAQRLIGQYNCVPYAALVYSTIQAGSIIPYTETDDGDELYVFSDGSGLILNGTSIAELTPSHAKYLKEMNQS